jgi:chemotaxis protein histidine kinase CheA
VSAPNDPGGGALDPHTLREFFREEAQELLDELRRCAPDITTDLEHRLTCHTHALTLKGSAAQVGLNSVGRAGAILARAIDLLEERSATDADAAAALARAVDASIPALDALITVSLAGDGAAEALRFGELLEHFPAADRVALLTALHGTGGPRYRPGPGLFRGAGVLPALADELAGCLIDLALAQTQLAGGEHTLAAPLAHTLTRLHRALGDLGVESPTVESLVVVQTGTARYALPASAVDGVHTLAAGAVSTPATGPIVILGPERLPALDLGRLAGAAPASPPAAAVVVAVATGRFALLVERAEAPRPMVLRPVEGALAAHPLLPHATVGPDGQLVFVLHAEALHAVLTGAIQLPPIAG